MEHFSEDVEYWETPFRAIESKQQLRNEWLVIERQQDIELSTSIFSSTTDNKHTIQWELSYAKDDNRHVWSGVYLIKLNDNGRCNYVYQVGERKLP